MSKKVRLVKAMVVIAFSSSRVWMQVPIWGARPLQRGDTLVAPTLMRSTQGEGEEPSTTLEILKSDIQKI